MTRAILPLLLAVSAVAAAPVQCPMHHAGTMPQVERRCPHQEKVDAWFEWRQANPRAHSRYRHGDHVHIGVLRLVDLQGRVSQFAADDEEPDPDPGFGGCGCDPAVALGPNGCGWWMSNVYSIARSLIHR